MNKRKILLVDDVKLFIELEKSFFHRSEFELLVAHNGREACEMALAQRPDLIFMDLFMPEMNGDEACRRLKAHPQLRSIPVVIVTQGGRPEEQERCRQAGCDDVLLKPVNRHDFIAAARRLLNVADRAEPRYPARLRVFYGRDRRKPLTDYSINLNTGGLFLETAHLLPPDTPLILEFSLPTRSAAVSCHGRVAWVNDPDNPPKPQLPPGIGVQFLDLSLEDMKAIREFITQKRLVPA